MNYIKHLTGFFERVTQDKNLNPTHISLYIALFQFWNCNRFKNPISISRDEVMRISKISSKATYHKCLKNLHTLGYIKYEPSYNPFRGSQVIMFNFAENLKPAAKLSSKNEPFVEPITEQVLNKQETSLEQVLVPYINSTNILNSSNDLNLGKLEQNSENGFVNSSDDIETNWKEKKLRQKKKEFIIPDIKEVNNYFLQQQFPEPEAQKFYNYYESNGWLIGGKTTMVDWQAAAQSWMSKTQIFNKKLINIPTNKPNYLSTAIEKNYAEPL